MWRNAENKSQGSDVRINDPIQLEHEIRSMHGCEARHLESVRVEQTFAERLPWEGVVEVFELVNFAAAKRCYAWGYRENTRTKSCVVLETPLITSAQSAVASVV